MIVQNKDAFMLLMAMTTVFVTVRVVMTFEGCQGIDDFRIGGSIHKPSIDTMNGA